MINLSIDAVWTDEWPTKAGHYWFYGFTSRDFQEKGIDKEKELVYVYLSRDNGFLNCRGEIWFKRNIGDGQWTPALLPKLPGETPTMDLLQYGSPGDKRFEMRDPTDHTVWVPNLILSIVSGLCRSIDLFDKPFAEMEVGDKSTCMFEPDTNLPIPVGNLRPTKVEVVRTA